ncbi:SDR family NAD(P)-dependent oxidoreductase [Methyloradius palustris]|uniref:Short-chain dehydrogenase n=1 Tax=Methyloradius palustris TaxID=2778876 RepID=A0A8D5G0B4_9PROT|nr:SDR family NAD(P)-dependent oxidoreductase [Methyloradius palustris]BCM25010.1 short-chain dehydrogenase [Methyloradius palustris]
MMNKYTKQQIAFQKKYGDWAIVTGASEGVGREMALSLAERGLNVVLVARRVELLERLSETIKKEFNVQTMVISADLSEISALKSLVQSTSALNIGLLIANAGYGTSGPLINADLQTELNMLDVNCRALLVLSHHYGKRFSTQKKGGIVLMSSIMAFQGVPNMANYAATKAYVQTLAEGLHIELAPYGVDVHASAPGPINTGFSTRSNLKMGAAAHPKTIASDTLNALGKSTTVRPGFLAKLLEYSLKLLPRWGRVRVMQLVTKGMMSH